MPTIPTRPVTATEKAAPIVAIGLFTSLVPLTLLVLLFTLAYPGLEADSRIAKNPTKAPHATAQADVVSAVVLSTADLPINYTSQGGGKFQSRRWTLVFGEFQHKPPMLAYYLQDHPEIGSTNWALDALTLRWATFWTFATTFAVGVLLVWTLTVVAVRNQQAGTPGASSKERK